MGRARKMKLLVSVALVLSITSMSLGFAAFSSVLNISSSATVTPNSEDFKLKIYGFASKENLDTFISKAQSGIIDESYLSDTTSIAMAALNATGEEAIINNSNLSIHNMNVFFTYPSSERTSYYFYIKNIGKYTVYYDQDSYQATNPVNLYTCGVDGTVINDTLDPCTYLKFGFFQADVDLKTKKGSMEPGDGLILILMWQYNGPYFDVPVFVQWNGLPIPYTTIPQSYE